MDYKTGKQKRQLREREKLKSTEVGLTEATDMRAGLYNVMLNVCCQGGSKIMIKPGLHEEVETVGFERGRRIV